MRTDLKNPNSFAVLTEDQIKKAKEDAKSIVLPEEKDKKDLINLGFKETFKNLKKLIKKDKVYEAQKAAFEAQLNENQKHFNDPISEKDIKKAKRDQQLLTKLVEKIDIASQDYAENVEMATNIVQGSAFAGGVFTGWIAKKAAKLFRMNPANKITQVLPYVVGIMVTLPVTIFAAKIQKQAARVGRFKERQELLKNPQILVYVYDKKADEIQDAKPLEEKKKPGFIKFLIQAYKDNKIYEAYMKKEGIEDKKLHKAIDNLQLSEAQLKEAKALQQNTFKTFNKVDEKSQTYAESVEALGQSIQIPIALFGSLLSMGLAFLFNRQLIRNPAKVNDKNMMNIMTGVIGKALTGMIAGLAPVFVTEYYITKEQKKASRVADMLAIKELNDYRHFV